MFQSILVEYRAYGRLKLSMQLLRIKLKQIQKDGKNQQARSHGRVPWPCVWAKPLWNGSHSHFLRPYNKLCLYAPKSPKIFQITRSYHKPVYGIWPCSGPCISIITYQNKFSTIIHLSYKLSILNHIHPFQKH